MGILIAAIITTVLAIVVIGLLVRRLSKREDRSVLILAFFFALPAQPIAFYYIRLPLHELLTGLLGAGAFLTAITLFYAPVTEEIAKWLALGVPSIRKTLKPENAVAIALAVGLGFGTGELWFIAERLSRSPQLAALPFYYFNGFLTERLMVCFLHGAFIALFFKRYAEGRSVWLAAFFGIVLHFLLNFPIYLSQINFFGLGPNMWGPLLVIYVALFTLAMFGFVNRLAKDKVREGFLGEATCPGCGGVYPRSFFALNLLTKRYERCPHCRKFHLVPMNQPPRDNGGKA
ncbi:MAG: YhfC family intramembrane metalloprotease [Xanthobacteraceae bacterium]|nr:YhfC family intramembrane metalloprotease [Xanthobacteraceae bacterium]